jgi:protein-S-isoprenylcysteine O-methyltransferase Ste14
MTRTDPPAADNDGVVVPPPLVFLAGLIAGYVIWWFWPVAIVPAEWALPVRLVGGLATVAGVALMAAAVLRFRREGTTPTHWEPTTRVVSTGPYRFSRNPIYVGMALVQAGLAMLGNALWPLLLVVPAIWVIQTQVIAREERYLEGKFGRDYLDYKARVRRWL